MQLVILVCQVEYFQNILRLNSRSFVFTSFIVLLDQVSLSGCFYFVRYFPVSVLQLFVNKAVTSQILKITLSFASSRFSTWPESQHEKLNIKKWALFGKVYSAKYNVLGVLNGNSKLRKISSINNF